MLWIQGAKGLQDGYQEGFYKNKKEINSDCLNEEIIGHIIELVEFL